MTFTVVWEDIASDALAELWIRAEDRQAVAESANRIDRELRNDAHRKGIQHGPFQAYYDEPLAVLFAVSIEDRMVRVLQVRRMK
jgi:hypothetical protein